MDVGDSLNFESINDYHIKLSQHSAPRGWEREQVLPFSATCPLSLLPNGRSSLISLHDHHRRMDRASTALSEGLDPTEPRPYGTAHTDDRR